ARGLHSGSLAAARGWSRAVYTRTRHRGFPMQRTRTALTGGCRRGEKSSHLMSHSPMPPNTTLFHLEALPLAPPQEACSALPPPFGALRRARTLDGAPGARLVGHRPP